MIHLYVVTILFDTNITAYHAIIDGIPDTKQLRDDCFTNHIFTPFFACVLLFW